MKIQSYLTFGGNCREAMLFYKECLGGELLLQTVSDSPMSGRLPDHMQHAVLHSTLIKGELVLMASDMVSEKGLQIGNGVSLMLNCESEEEIRLCYEKLAVAGEKTHPLEVTFWGALFGDLIDKYGNQWLLHYQMNEN